MPTAKKCKKSCMGFFDELAQKVMKGKEAQKSNAVLTGKAYKDLF